MTPFRSDLKDGPKAPSSWMMRARIVSFRRMHLPMFVTVLVLSTFGIVVLFSASLAVSYAREGDASALFLKQAKISLGGLIVALGIAGWLRIRAINRPLWAYLVYAGTTLMLLAVPVIGRTINGAKRWLYLGPVSFQPSEVAKLAAVFCLAVYFSERRRRRRQQGARRLSLKERRQMVLLDVVVPGVAMGLWIVLVLAQPHLSGAIILSLITMFMFLFEGLPKRSLIAGGLILVILLLIVALLFVALAPLLFHTSPIDFIKSHFAHVFKRLASFNDRDAANPDDVRQIEQAEIALGSGGWLGVGLGRSVQKMNWLPESHNDFIVAILGEELGLLGTLLCLMLFLLFFVFGMQIAVRAATSMTAAIAAGYTFWITIQALLNIGVASHVLPTTGISLPFFSFGGTANFFFMVACGMILCVSKYGQREDPDVKRVLEHDIRTKKRRAADGARTP